MRHALLAIMVFASTFAASSLATIQPPPKPPLTAPPAMESFQLVLLVRGPAWTPEKTEATAKLQAEHIAHLTKLGNAGKIVVAGPFGDQEDETKRGACIYRVGSIEEARRLASEDPAVKAGRLKVEAMTWWVEKGYMTFPKAPEVVEEAPTPGAK